MPVFNGARFIGTAIDSVLRQDFRDLELIISDNASTDDTAQIVRRYARQDSRIRYTLHEANRGPYANFLFALSAARGKHFAWLAHDDHYETPAHIGQLSAELDAGAALAFSNVNIIEYDDAGALIGLRRDHFGRYYRGRARGVAMSLAAIRASSQQFYGLYRIESLRRHLHLLAEDQRMACFNESRLIHKFIADEPTSFIADAFLNVAAHHSSASRSIDSSRLLRDYLRFTARLLPLYSRSPSFTALEKLRLYAQVAFVHCPYALQLLASSVKTRLRS
jgi:glycosyltransferase involved in cell wall biosynthesis